MSSSMLEQVVQHFTHIHPLTKVDGYGEFTCDGCKTYGCGKTYQCATCNYGLHDHCALCSPNLLSFMHPQHELQLVYRQSEQTHQKIRICDICDESIEGIYYHCEPCSFDIHPLCTQLPQHVRHIPHPAHLLELNSRGASNTCMVCQGVIQSWRYNCSPCGLNIHMECVHSFALAKPAATQQRGFESQPQSHMSYPPDQHHKPYASDQHHQPYASDQHHQSYPHDQHRQFYPHDQHRQPYPPDQHHQPYPPDQHHQPYPFDQQHQLYPPYPHHKPYPHDQHHQLYPPDHHHQPYPFVQQHQSYPSDQHHQPYLFYQHYQLYPFDQHYRPYYDHGYNYGYIYQAQVQESSNQGQVQESSNQGQVQESSPSKGKKMFKILSALTTVIISPACAVIGLFLM